jgi:hypothetical protein
MGDGETEKERLERNYGDLLQELRVAQTGVQILFAFLLTLPFAARFGEINDFDRGVYLVSLLTAAGAAALIISPVAYHRSLFRRGRKAELVRSAHRMASGGLALLAVAMVGAILLVTDVVAGRVPALIIATGAAVLFGVVWALLPWRARKRVPGDLDDLLLPPM